MVSNFGRKKGQWVSPRQLIWIGGDHTSCEKINTARVHRNSNDPSTQITWQLQRHFETKNFGTIISRMRRQEFRDIENPFRCVPSVLCFTGPTCLTVKYHSFGDFRELDLRPALSEHTCLQWTGNFSFDINCQSNNYPREVPITSRTGGVLGNHAIGTH
jgi:hypothetical protein